MGQRGKRTVINDVSPNVLSYGGGVQTVAMAVLVTEGVLPRPDYVIAADTGREVQSTWDFLESHARPLLAHAGLDVQVAPHSLATVDLYGKNGDLLLPVFTATGKMPTFCSVEWKARVVQRHLRSQGVNDAAMWIGFSLEEKKRVKSQSPGPWQRVYPLLDLSLTRDDCEQIITRVGLPIPQKSACFMCPHRRNAEWRAVRDQFPEQWDEAVRLDEELREADDQGGVFLHRSLTPLAYADIDAPDRISAPERQCGLGMCFV